MPDTETITKLELSNAVLRVADIVETQTNRFGIYADGAPISHHVLVYAMVPVDSSRLFDWKKWQEAFRQTRRDGTRSHVKAVNDELRDVLIKELGDEIGAMGGGTHYTPAAIRAVAQRITATRP
ncbi:hypothetical protein ACWC09_26560 [Streptomyces sp. NPDC001617]